MQSTDGIINVQFAAPHPDLRPYVTTYYAAEIIGLNGSPVEDLLHPEWGSVRYVCNGAVSGGNHLDELASASPVTVVGPSSLATRMICLSMRVASFGLLPLGWHRFVGLPASDFADRIVDARDIAAKVDFVSLYAAIAGFSELSDVTTVFDNALLTAMMQTTPSQRKDDAVIEALHRALHDPDVSSVAEIADRLHLTGAQIERLSKRAFGFPPKLLIRRQRFLRTLGLLIRQPKAKWSDILDPQYHDQAHFNRDFQRFFGMSPTQYLALNQPIVSVAAAARMAALGNPLQGLHAPRDEA